MNALFIILKEETSIKIQKTNPRYKPNVFNNIMNEATLSSRWDIPWIDLMGSAFVARDNINIFVDNSCNMEETTVLRASAHALNLNVFQKGANKQSSELSYHQPCLLSDVLQPPMSGKQTSSRLYKTLRMLRNLEEGLRLMRFLFISFFICFNSITQK